MKYVAIVAEFNPLHNGHAYLLDKVRAAFPEHKIVIIQSGNFTQRGEAAVLDKYVRAYHAVSVGADAVFELPFPFCSSNSQHFAEAAIKIMAALKNVEYIAFGSECGSAETIERLEKETIETPELSAIIKENCKTLSYPAAMEKSLKQIGVSDEDIYSAFLPNNALAIQYLRAIKRYAPYIKPFTVKRIGADYNSETTLSEYPSALSVRTEFLGGRVSKNLPFCVQNDLNSALNNKENQNYSDVFFRLLQGATLNKSSFTDYYDCDETLSALIMRELFCAKDLDVFLHSVKNKRYTMARIKRVALFLQTDVTKSFYADCLVARPILNLLAVRDGTTLGALRNDATTNLIISANELNNCENKLANAICRADKLYQTVFSNLSPQTVRFLVKNKA